MPGLTPETPPSKGCMPRRSCGIGCMVVTMLFLGGAIYTVVKKDEIFANSIDQQIGRLLVDAQVPEPQKSKTERLVRQFSDDLRAGRIDTEAYWSAVAPTVIVLRLMAFDMQLVQASTLSDDQKKDATRQIQRCARGLAENRIKLDDALNALPPPSNKAYDADKLSALVAAFQKMADDASIPDEAYTYDFAGELERGSGK